MTSLATTLRQATERLSQYSEQPYLEAQLLLAHSLGQPRTFLYAHPEQSLPEVAAQYFAELLDARRAGTPIAYLTGEREFWSRLFRVTPQVLIPRPDTELLVELVLQRVRHDAAARLVDLGTGSGAIGITLGLERAGCTVWGVDVSPDALEVANDNAQRLGATNVRWVCSDWFTAIAERSFDLVVSNPPYVAVGDPHLTQGDLRFEPALALVAGDAGLDAIRHLIPQARSRLNPAGWLLLEHGCQQGEAVRKLLRSSGFERVETYRDLAGLPRASCGRVPA